MLGRVAGDRRREILTVHCGRYWCWIWFTTEEWMVVPSSAGRGRVREYFKCTWFHAASSAKGSCPPSPGPPPSTIVADSRLSFFHLSPFAIQIVVVVSATQKGKSSNINFPQYLSNYSPSSSCFCSCCWQTSIKKTSSSSLPCILSSLPRGPTSATVDTSGRGASSFSSFLLFVFLDKLHRFNRIHHGRGIDGTRYSGAVDKTHRFPLLLDLPRTRLRGPLFILAREKKGKFSTTQNSRRIPALRALFTQLSVIASPAGRLP